MTAFGFGFVSHAERYPGTLPLHDAAILADLPRWKVLQLVYAKAIRAQWLPCEWRVNVNDLLDFAACNEMNGSVVSELDQLEHQE